MLFLIKNIEVARVNLLMNDLASGLPSPLAFLGLGTSMAISLGLEERKWNVAILPVLHAVYVSEGRLVPEKYFKSGRFETDEIQEGMTGHISCSFFIDIPDCDDEKAVERAFVGKRIAGGDVQNDLSNIRVEVVASDGGSLPSLRRGYALTSPREKDFRKIAWGNPADLSAVADILFGNREKAGWHVPAAVGYKLLEDDEYQPSLKEGTRDETIPHAFCDPVVGVSELISIRNPELTALNTDEFRSLFWKWDVKGKFILGHPDYHR